MSYRRAIRKPRLCLWKTYTCLLTPWNEVEKQIETTRGSGQFSVVLQALLLQHIYLLVWRLSLLRRVCTWGDGNHTESEWRKGGHCWYMQRRRIKRYLELWLTCGDIPTCSRACTRCYPFWNQLRHELQGFWSRTLVPDPSPDRAVTATKQKRKP